jgi:hypothetical protein
MDDRKIFDQKMTLQGGRLKRILEPGSQPEIAYRTMAGWATRPGKWLRSAAARRPTTGGSARS